MKENSFVFFTLLYESRSIESDNRFAELAISAYPYLDKENGKSLVDSFRNPTDDILDLTGGEEQSSIEEIKQVFNN